MPIPDYQTIMLPLLNFYADGKEHKNKEATEYISDKFSLSPEENLELMQSGQSVIYNRTAWAKTYLLKAGLLSSPRRGHAVISERGRDILSTNPEHIDVAFLESFPEFLEFRSIKKETNSDDEELNILESTEDSTPDELMERGYKSIHANLELDLLDRLRDVDPYYFESIVGILLTAMGYGRFEPTPGSGDDGIDGIVYQDKLGLDKIFFQSKRYKGSNTVPAMAVRDFVGTLDLHGVNKGIFITTSKFPKDTQDILKKTQKNIILIDGPKFASLMIEHDVGVSTEKKYLIKKIDSDFFIEE